MVGDGCCRHRLLGNAVPADEAAGFGLAVWILTAIWLLRSPAPVRQRTAVFLGFAVPLGLGLPFNWRITP